MSQAGIGCDKNLEAAAFRRVEQLAICELRPATLIRSRNFVLRQNFAQRYRRTLVKQDAHSGRGKRTAGSVLQDSANLGNRDARKPFHELRHRCAILEILEQRGHGYSGAPEYPGSADAVRVLLDRNARRPIDHDGNASTIAMRRLTTELSGRTPPPLRIGEHAFHCEHDAPTVRHGPLQRVVRWQLVSLGELAEIAQSP